MAPKRNGAGKSGGRDSSILAKITKSDIVAQGRRTACDTVYVAKKLLRSTGKAAWIAGTTAFIIIVPLIIQGERDQISAEMEFQQGSLFGPSPPGTLQYQ